MDKEIRSVIERATQRARRLLEDDFASQLEATFDVLRAGTVAPKAGSHLTARQVFQRDKIVAAIEHKQAAGMSAAEAVADYLRDAAFTALNRFVALKMLEARELVQECITRGEQSAGYREFCGLAPGVALLPDSSGYRLYIESLFDELSIEVKVLFDRRDPASVLWPRRATFEALLEILNDTELVNVWGEDETIGWVYQYFNALEERQAIKDVKSGGSPAPRNSRELAIRNQFFTPRYIVRFLTDNTLGRLWWEMRGGHTALRDRCEFLTLKPGATPQDRKRKDPRDIRVIDPACGSGHFLLYVFDLLLYIYEEGWADPDAPASTITGRTLRDDYPSINALQVSVPELIVRHNLFGVDIDPRCVQVASFALWLRAQRAWSELRVPQGSRPRVEHSNVILAEPMPGDAKLIRDFASQVGHPALAALFEKIVGAFKLAGDLGIMLRVDQILEDAIRDAEQSSRQGTVFEGATSRAFWNTAESRLVQELVRFAVGNAGRDHERRRLFRNDSTHGLALLDAARTRFDVVLMNPPFGDPSGPSKEYIEGAYPDSRQDIFAVFVDRCVRDLAPAGLIGVISTEAGFFRRTLEPWRRDVLLANTRMEVMAHLGGHVLDGATVRVAAYALAAGSKTGSSLYLRLLGEGRQSRESILRQAVDDVRAGRQSDRVFFTDQREFEKLPYAVFGYWCSAELRDVFVSFPALEGCAGSVKVGLQTSDDTRFLRLRWEVDPNHVGKGRWLPFAKGGEYSPFVGDIHLVVAEHGPSSALAAFPSSYIRNPEAYRKPGLTYTPRTNKRFTTRILPAGCVFANKGPSIVGTIPDAWALAGILNSRVVSYLLSFGLGAAEAEGGAGANSYEVGLVQRLPLPKTAPDDPHLRAQAQRAWVSRAESSLRDETTTIFAGPAAPCGLRETLADTWRELVACEDRRLDEYVAAQESIDRRTCDLYGLTAKDWLEIETNVGPVHRPEVARDERARGAWTETIVSFLVGCAFGRWAPPRLSRAAALNAAQAFTTPEGHHDEIDNAPSVLVDDPGHALDIMRRCEAALETVAGPQAHQLVLEAAESLGVDELRLYLRAQFFESHIKTYTKSRRIAPIFLPFATQSGQYLIWLYLHRVGGDTLFTVHSEILAPKLRLEEGRLAGMQAEGAMGAAGRKQLANQQAFVDELRFLVEEIRRITPLWKPNLNDGVVINFAPLWRLFPQHKPWQSELKATWAGLCAEDYEWAHLAMRLWPERVVPKCATDRSIAVAHGLEGEFWVQGTDGKWKPRTTPLKSVAELVRERTSPAVKAALKSLLDVPTASSNGRARSRRAASLAVTKEEGR